MSAPRILIVRFSAIGDCIMASWAVSALRQTLPDATIHWAIQDRCAPVLAEGRLIDSIAVVDKTAWKKRRWSPTVWRSQMATFSALRAHKFDVGFDFQGHFKTAMCLRITGAKVRLAGRATDAFSARLNHVVTIPENGLHEVERSHALVSSWHECALPILPIMPEIPSIVAGSFVSIQTGAGAKGKAYPADKWREVARLLVAGGERVVTLGGANDPLLDLPGVEDYVGKLSLRESLGVVRASRIHLASDTGTGHAAAAYGVPVVSVMGPMPPAKYRPYTQNGVVLEKGIDPSAVSVSSVIEAVESLGLVRK